ncbi:hypothetical protein [Roseomonas sp. WA12]
MAQSKTKSEAAGAAEPAGLEETIAYLAKRHKVSQAIVREIARKLGSADRIAIERDIERGKARR